MEEGMVCKKQKLVGITEGKSSEIDKIFKKLHEGNKEIPRTIPGDDLLVRIALKRPNHVRKHA